MSGNIAITGVPTEAGSDGSVPLRREIRDLQANYPDQFNLFILGTRALMAVDQQDLLSYYQIAGIHGLPFKPWNGVASTSDWESTGGFGGYCTHSSVLFTTWHRAYMALYEQVLYDAVQNVAEKFPTSLRDRYVQAARDFRAPYFDWAMVAPSNNSAFPTVISDPSIAIVDVDGQTKAIPNPLYQYAFHPMNPSPGDFTDDWAVYPTTVRHPNRAGKSQDQQIGPILENESDSLRTNVSTLLLSYTDFDAFTSNQWDANTDQNAYGSLEDVHNEIHDKIGGNGGHMGALEVAAFDAAFWLHHGNVDRLYAIWQALHPSSFITAQPAPISTFGVEAGTQQTAASDLTPFWDASGRRFWTPAQLKDTAVFGYAYPETQSWQYADPSQYQDALRQAVATLYGSNVFSAFAGAQDQAVPAQAATSPQKVVSRGAQGAILSRAVARTADEKQPTKQDVAPRPAATPTPTHPAGPIPASLAHLAPDSTYTEWFVNVRAQKHGLGESFRLLVFLGAVPADPQAWQLAPDVVGRVSVLGRRRTTPCAKCRRDGAGELMVSGTVPLTTALLRRHVGGRGPQSLDAEHVVPYLRGQLAWRVSLFADGLEKDALDVPGLKVSVVSTQVRIGADGLPVHSGQYEVHPEVTAGMPGGLNPGEEVESR